MSTARIKALELAQTVDAIIYVGGIGADLEREFNGRALSRDFSTGTGRASNCRRCRRSS